MYKNGKKKKIRNIHQQLVLMDYNHHLGWYHYKCMDPRHKNQLSVAVLLLATQSTLF